MPPKGSEFLPMTKRSEQQRSENRMNSARNPQSEHSDDDFRPRKSSKDSNPRLSIGSFISDIDKKDHSEFIKVGVKQKKTI